VSAREFHLIITSAILNCNIILYNVKYNILIGKKFIGGIMAERPVSILVVDDDMDILKMLKEVLTKKGWKAFIAPTGEAAMANMASEKIDIVLLDIRLPDKTGLEILKDIRKGYPDVKVIMITGFGYDNALIDESIKQGACGYVSKGAPLSEIMESIQNALTG
jgi:DNA-binding NtrC family response regulator